MRIGLDFGTTNSSAAMYQNGRLVVATSPATDPTGILPSLIYITRQHETILGRAAAQRYLQDDTGRPAEWETRSAGLLEFWSGMPDGESVFVAQEILVDEDVGARGRLLQSIKTALRSPTYAGTRIFKRFYTIEELITIVLGELRAAAARTLGEPVDEVLLGRPVRFSEQSSANGRAEDILRAAADLAGFRRVDFMAEPIAAAYAYHTRLTTRQTALVFDFGGGTLDLSVIRLGGERRPEVLATHGLLIGGDNFDQRIMEKFLWKRFGYGKTHEGNRKLSYEIYDYLLDWARHPDLTRLNYYRDIKRAATVNKAGPEFTALYSLVHNQYGFKLFETIEQAKIALSSAEDVTLAFHEPGIDIDQPISRVAFSRAIQDYLDAIDAGVEQVITDAGLGVDRIDLVLCTGGSSAVPAVVERLAAHFGAARIVPYDRFLSVSSGLAIAASLNGHA